MDGIGERIKRIRKDNKMTQEAFADKLGMKRSSISIYEIDNSAPSAGIISLICREFNVSETWLRTGEGEPYVKKTQHEEIAEFIQKIEMDDDKFKAELIAVLSQFNDSDWKALRKVLEKMAPLLGDSVQDPKAVAPDLEDMSVAELEGIYKKQDSSELSGSTLPTSHTTTGTA